MAVSMDISQNTSASNVKVPLYTVTQNDPSGCTTDYDHAFVFPRMPIAPTAIYSLPIEVLAQDQSKESLSAYLTLGAALAKAIAPQSVAAVATADTIANSAAAQAVRDQVNANLSTRTSSRQDLILIEADRVDHHDRDIAYSVAAYPFDKNYNPKSDPPIPLANLTLSLRWRNTAL